MPSEPNILLNGLSLNAGGAFVVGYELFLNMARLKPDWKFTFALISGLTFHNKIDESAMPENCHILWTPPSTLNRFRRMHYERNALVKWAEDHHVDVVHQLNGMVIPTMRTPSLAHFQDPLPYRSIAWDHRKDRFVSFLKRREHRRALLRAACATWTSHYLEQLTCGYWKIKPKKSVVLHNGINADWITRAEAGFTDWSSRPLEIATISTVLPYKRQELVIRAMAKLVKKPGLENLKSRIVGLFRPESFRQDIERLIDEIDLGDNVILEGHVSGARVQQVFREAKCFVLMSVCESFGIPAIEAMSFGTPVVTADCCAIPEICGDAAALVKLDDLDDLVSTLEEILNDPNRAEQMRQAGVENIKRFNWSKIAGKLIECFEDIMSEKQ